VRQGWDRGNTEVGQLTNNFIFLSLGVEDGDELDICLYLSLVASYEEDI